MCDLSSSGLLIGNIGDKNYFENNLIIGPEKYNCKFSPDPLRIEVNKTMNKEGNKITSIFDYKFADFFQSTNRICKNRRS